MQERVKTLAEIMRANPEAQAYIREWREGMAAKQQFVPEAAEECPVCGIAGFVRADLPVEHPNFGDVVPCPNPSCPVLSTQRAERYAKLCTLAQIPDEYEGLTLENWRQLFDAPEFQTGKLDAFGAALAFVAARERGYRFTLDDVADMVNLERPPYASASRCSMVLTGTYGVGKTSLAVCIARELIDVYQLPAMYLLMDRFFAALHERFSRKDAYELFSDADDDVELVQMFQQAPVLILDEFPLKPGTSDWWEQQVYQLVNYRHVYHMPTVITTNYSIDDLTQSWGARIGSRLHTMAHWIQMGGLELRRRDATWKSR